MSTNINKLFEQWHDATSGGYTLKDIARWIEEHTTINGAPFSYKNHEYQKRILESTAPVIAVKKCSQVGISELAIRRALACADIADGFSSIYTLPSSRFAQDFAKTRANVVINGSDRLKMSVDKNMDNASIKQFGNSFLYFKGTIGDSASISVPADMITVDEIDFSDQNNVEKLQSRLTHSPYKWWFYLSTPTVEGFGIDKKFQDSKRHYNFCKCNHCNHWFVPDYLEHVKIPDYHKPLLDISSNMLAHLRYQEAKLFCPSCGKEPDLFPAYREWVCENPFDNYPAEGFQVNPFDAPAIITPSYLVETSTRFKRKVNFVNYHLGQTMADKDSGLNKEDLELMRNVGMDGIRGSRVIGVDLGTQCHIMVAVVDGYERMCVIETLRVHYTKLRIILNELRRKHRPVAIVSDSQPYVETVHTMQQEMPELFGSVYINTKALIPFRVVDNEENKEKMLLEVRQVNVNRNYALDILMSEIRQGNVGLAPSLEDDSLIESHLYDMKRVPKSADVGARISGEEADADEYMWVKTKGEDHYHHALLYTYVASKMMHRRDRTMSVPLFVSGMKMKTYL